MSDAKPNQLLEWMKAHPYVGPFRSRATYFITGDFISCYFEDACCYAEDDTCENVTVYRAMDDRRIVGFKIWSPDNLKHEAVQRVHDNMAKERPRWTKLAAAMPAICFLLILVGFAGLIWQCRDPVAFWWNMAYYFGVCLPTIMLMIVAQWKTTPDELRRLNRF